MTNWTKKDDGAAVFVFGQWTVTWDAKAVSVHHADPDIDVEVDADELSVFGEARTRTGGYTVRVGIPFPVMRAILEAQDAIGAEVTP